MLLVQSSVYCGSNSWKVCLLKLSVIFRYSASKSPDYVLSKAGLFSTKLSQTIIAWNLLFYTKSPFFSSLSQSCNHERVSTHARWCKRLCTTVVRVYCAISGFWECATWLRDCTISHIARNIYMHSGFIMQVFTISLVLRPSFPVRREEGLVNIVHKFGPEEFWR